MIQLTPAAAAALKKLMAEEAVPDHALRIQVVGGGCEGLYYNLDLLAAPSEFDEETLSQGVRLLVDRRALPLLDGTTIDFQGTFRFENPKAQRTCRCGASFR